MHLRESWESTALLEISRSHGGEYEDVSWNIAPCILVEIDRRFRDAFCRARLTHLPDDGGSKHL
jgi:hypothetical protein